ncbi:acetyl-/propionyl-coenzyme A carboxylase alpha chain [Cordyceps fumosorosea ARSEF 2679]|uniref:Acetyl-/propionyl-coenzyme A carboxylase alpha chain n=1 Tax=Cordyceps fumosorosea (strain ARSEF 2679) TaxID=1081104 RepID=A0A167N542_CORFA|nr:acetyl-/propionyl-coenzyme A carboxylase alpha chain [Cordyceps fumosorosea ARSEF 2679]OAA55137.1 acetyl-/propionyl-coenzyme A carboxylase alpha chain [Cordyceps fumosorosea ARSEF 2679]
MASGSNPEPLRHIRKALIANRGEIAVRCVKACKELGVHSIAIFTTADATSLHAKLADDSVLLPGDAATAYTDSASILEVCKRVGADAVIPGYGFLSEDAGFADAVAAAGIVFVGPSAASIRAVGLKHEARAVAVAADVPVIPGTALLDSTPAACEAARALGFPVMLKATGGGGGVGLHVCNTEAQVADAFTAVQRRGNALFNNDGVFLERYYPSARHVEVQVAGNGAGLVVALGERECSLQRRHQKVVEECPSPFVARRPELRERLCRAATRFASRLAYKSVGTVEFLVDDETADFFFLEMNTRLQVEHGVTELCYGVDLLHLMLRQADHERAGRPGVPSEELRELVGGASQGWAIECRVYAEVPLRDFIPAPGVLQHVRWPEGDGIRVDTWVTSGQVITPHYDPLVAKIMVHSPDGRSAAQVLMLEALTNTALQGTQTNLEYLAKVVASPMFVDARTLTDSLSTFRFESCSVQVLDPGVLTTVQDYPGRADVGHGIPPGGPMDDLSSRGANVLVGNEPGVELLEITLVGPELLFHEAAVVAICGAKLPVTLQGQARPMWSRLVVGKGQTLRLGRVGRHGARAYFAVKGGFPQVARYLGSKSTAPELGIGGVQGRKLQEHDILALDPQSGTWAQQASPFSLPKESLPVFDSDNAIVMHCLDGPYGSEDILSPEGQDTLYNSEWSVSHNSSRSGVRLSGPRLKWARTSGGGGGSHPSNIFEYGYPDGGVNFTGESPIIFAHDRPGLGGFACLTTVCSADMWKVGQLRTGNKVRFLSISFEDALRLSERKRQYLQAIAAYSQGGDCAIPPPHVQVAKAPASSILHQTPASGSHPRVTYRQGGDAGIVVEYGEQVPNLRNTTCVHLLLQGLSRAQLPGVRGEPNFATLTVYFNPQKTPRASLLARLLQLDSEVGEVSGIQIPARQVRLPVCLDHSSLAESSQRYMEHVRPTAAYMPDNVEYLRRNNALATRQDVFDTVLKAPWLTVAVGFFVGTPILYPLDPWRVITGQKYNPTRTYTPRGSIGLGGSLAAIYPVASPGGYQLMGRTLGGWDAAGNRPGFSPEKPWLFNQFDLVKFYQVSEEEYARIEQDFEAGRFVFDITETTINMDEYIAQFDEVARNPKYQDWKRRKEMVSIDMADLEEKLYQEWVEAQKLATADATEQEGDEESDDVALIKSPVDANVWKVLVQEGDEIKKGQVVAILEAMKMEINITAGEKEAGFVVAGIAQPPGSVVCPGKVIIRARRNE